MLPLLVCNARDATLGELPTGTWWREVRGHLGAFERVTSREVLEPFGPDAASLSPLPLDHLGIYVADYAREDEAEGWLAELGGLERSGEISRLDFGPSYIAPREYGTPGWWASFAVQGSPVELFACRRYGPWARMPAPHRSRLMSHYALRVRCRADVKTALERVARSVQGQVIAYTTSDKVGHTYGHVRHPISPLVVEVVAREEASR